MEKLRTVQKQVYRYIKFTTVVGFCILCLSGCKSNNRDETLQTVELTGTDTVQALNNENFDNSMNVAEPDEYEFMAYWGQLTECGEFYDKELFEQDGAYEIHICYFDADLTHDGIDDLVETVVFSTDPNAAIVAATNGYSFGNFVKVYRGIGEEQYESEACFVSRGFTISHAGNGAICLVEYDGQDYLLISNMDESQGIADYNYSLFYIDDADGIIIKDRYGVGFTTDKVHYPDYMVREESEPSFDEHIEKYIDGAVVLFVMDIDYEALYSDGANIIYAEEYFSKKLQYLK